jgi:hypothetical protein
MTRLGRKYLQGFDRESQKIIYQNEDTHARKKRKSTKAQKDKNAKKN